MTFQYAFVITITQIKEQSRNTPECSLKIFHLRSTSMIAKKEKIKLFSPTTCKVLRWRRKVWILVFLPQENKTTGTFSTWSLRSAESHFFSFNFLRKNAVLTQMLYKRGIRSFFRSQVKMTESYSATFSDGRLHVEKVNTQNISLESYFISCLNFFLFSCNIDKSDSFLDAMGFFLLQHDFIVFSLLFLSNRI